MTLLFVCGVLNHCDWRFGHLVGVRDKPLGLPVEDIKFELREINQFLLDRNLREDALAFSFDMDIDMTPIMNWNTHTVFAYLICEFETKTSKTNSISVWD